jgi:hypothetical protein
MTEDKIFKNRECGSLWYFACWLFSFVHMLLWVPMLVTCMCFFCHGRAKPAMHGAGHKMSAERKKLNQLRVSSCKTQSATTNPRNEKMGTGQRWERTRKNRNPT